MNCSCYRIQIQCVDAKEGNLRRRSAQPRDWSLLQIPNQMATDEPSGGAALLDAQFGLLMTEIAGIRNEVMLNSTQTTELVERCVRRGQKCNFRSKGNEKQHDFNEGIAACCA